MNITRKIYNLKCKIRDICIKQIKNGEEAEIDSGLLLNLEDLFLNEKKDFFVEVYGDKEGMYLYGLYVSNSNTMIYLARQIISAAEYSVMCGKKVCPKI